MTCWSAATSACEIMARSEPPDQALLNPLETALRTAAPQRVLVAWSGGPDSTALLHACKQLGFSEPLLAVHVNHGLQPTAAEMAAWCRREADQLGLPCRVLGVDGAPQCGDSIEAWARHQRYAALARVSEPGDVVLTAHHADDQAESVLLALLRGSGLPGLAGLADARRLGAAHLLRPWKSVPHSAIADYVQRQGLATQHDPSNDDDRHTRNWLRHAVMPAVFERFPAASTTLARTAAHAAEAQGLLDELAAADLGQLQPDGASINMAPLRQLSAARQRNVLRHWLAQRGLPLPSSELLEQLLTSVVHASQDAQPLLRIGSVEARRHCQRLYVDVPLPAPPQGWQTRWQARQCSLPAGLGTLTTTTAGDWTVRLPQPGDVVRQAGRPRKPLTRWCQEQGVPVWLRSRAPMVFAGDTLCAIGGRTLDADCAPKQLLWQTTLPGAQTLVA